MRSYSKLFIGGDWVSPAGGATIDVLSPHGGELVGSVPEGTPADIDRAVAAARHAFDEGDWPHLDPVERIALLERFSAIYSEHLTEMADLITAEMGSPISFSRGGQAPGAWMVLNAFIDVAKGFRWEEHRAGVMADDVIVRREPAGVVGAIVPWNAPQVVTMSKLAPALLAGCCVVLKPAPETPLDANLLAELLAAAGLPAGVMSVVPAGREVAEHLVRHPGVDKIAFTGSTAAGRRIGAICGEQLKRCSLELGGKSAAIILDDADLDATVRGLKFASLVNNGEACVAQTRLLVSRDRHDEFVGTLAKMVAGLRVGDPADPQTDIGPLVAERQQARVAGYIALGQREGAEPVVGGDGMPDGLDAGWYVRPTVFTGVSNDMRIAREEIFGPVLSVIPYSDVNDAVRIANDSEYGLAGSVWTSDGQAGLGVARRVRSGIFGVNNGGMDFKAPFGGMKSSGIGREYGDEGLDEYTETKTIVPDASIAG
jgi:betaine-aldehyde dehydrogenase